MAHKWIAAAVQMDCVPYDKDANLRHAAERIADAASQGARLVVLPELFNTGYRVEVRDMELAEDIPGHTTRWMQDMARRYGIYLAGALLERGADGLIYDTQAVQEEQHQGDVVCAGALHRDVPRADEDDRSGRA